MRFLRRALVGLFLTAVSLALVAQAGRLVWTAAVERMTAEPRAFPQREQVLAVNVVNIAAQRLTPVLTVYGEVRAVRRLSLRAPAGGVVIETDPALVEGGSVKAGQLLARIDPVEAEADLARARADLSDAEAETRDAARAVTLARDELVAAEAQAALRDRALERQRGLQGRGIATAADLEAAELAASSAAQSVLSARETVSAAEARVDQADTALARTRIALAEAERLLASTRVTAAFDGVLGEVSVTPGVRVTANEQIAELIDPERLEVALRVSTAQYAQLRAGGGDPIGAPVTATLRVAGEGLDVSGRITRESAAVGAGQTGRQLFATLDPAAFLRPGDFVEVAIEEPEMAGVTRLPATALGADDTVLVIENERLTVAPVELLRRQGDMVIVRAPDLEGAQVVAERTPLLGAGIKVRPIEPEAAAASMAEDLIPLDDERRARLRAFLQEDSDLPEGRRAALLAQIEDPMVPAALVARLEDRMGG